MLFVTPFPTFPATSNVHHNRNSNSIMIESPCIFMSVCCWLMICNLHLKHQNYSSLVDKITKVNIYPFDSYHPSKIARCKHVYKIQHHTLHISSFIPSISNSIGQIFDMSVWWCWFKNLDNLYTMSLVGLGCSKWMRSDVHWVCKLSDQIPVICKKCLHYYTNYIHADGVEIY